MLSFIIDKYIDIINDIIIDEFIPCDMNSTIKPKIPIRDYLISRFCNYFKKANAEISVFIYIISLYYIIKLNNDNIIPITVYNIHRLILTTMVLSIKMYEDEFPSNQVFANIGGVKLNDMNRMEYFLLKKLKYNLFVNYKLFNDFIEKYQLGLHNKIIIPIYPI